MKRSEMIDIIETIAHKDGAYLYSNTANDILEAMEKAGIIPPKYEDYEASCYYDRICYRNEWEPEDETFSN